MASRIAATRKNKGFSTFSFISNPHRVAASLPSATAYRLSHMAFRASFLSDHGVAGVV
jgi:hypothetical protein